MHQIVQAHSFERAGTTTRVAPLSRTTRLSHGVGLRIRRALVHFALAGIAAITPMTRAVAQTKVVGDSIHAAKTLFTWRDGVLAAGFVGLTIGMFPADRALAEHLQDSSTQANHFLKNASRDVQFIADPGSIFIGVGLYGVGRLAHWREVADLGLHGTEAVALSSAFTGLPPWRRRCARDHSSTATRTRTTLPSDAAFAAAETTHRFRRATARPHSPRRPS